MKTFALLLITLACLPAVGCQQRRRDNEAAAALLNQLQLMAVQEIAHEKNGEPPPKHFTTWQAFWHNRFFALEHSPEDPRHRQISIKQIAAADVTFIRRKRAEMGLPPID